LSKLENIPQEQWCYVANKDGNYEKGMRMAANYLQRTGYRLPREAEWEYACRAGAETTFSFGEAEEVLGQYGWYILNASNMTHPVGMKKPNELGLFDMHGNVWQWCQDIYNVYPKGKNGKAVNEKDTIVGIIAEEQKRMLRGGTYDDVASRTRSAKRFARAPADSTYEIGFRPARTMP
jgi:eukaryotic-like serine/threonine-protein kinase